MCKTASNDPNCEQMAPDAWLWVPAEPRYNLWDAPYLDITYPIPEQERMFLAMSLDTYRIKDGEGIVGWYDDMSEGGFLKCPPHPNPHPHLAHSYSIFL